MRIISQGKDFDVSYENNDIERKGKEIFINKPSFDNRLTWLGGYETKERTLEVMEEIRDSHMTQQRIFVNDAVDGLVAATINVDQHYYYFMPKE
jgi:hypothetical protein